MSTFENIFGFLADLAPDIIRLVSALYEAFDGDVEKARRNIEDRRAEVRKLRAERDRQLDARFPEDGNNG